MTTSVLTHPITRFVARRLLYSLAVLIGVLVVVFALVHLVPGDPVRIALGTRYTPEAYAALRSASGLDRPLIQQFFGYIGSALTGDLGVSFRNGDPVTVTLFERLPATVSLGLVGIVIALLIALPAGIWSALHEGRALRRDRPYHQPVRGVGSRFLDGDPVDRVIRVDARLAADVGLSPPVRRSRRAGCATSCCPV